MNNFKQSLQKLVHGVGWHFGRGFSKGATVIPFKETLRASANRESVDFFLANMRQAWVATTRQEIWKAALHNTSGRGGGLILEFGVHKGRSLNWFALHSEQEVFGFDNFFDGLQEDWAGALPRGFFAQKQLPKVQGNATLIVGRVQNELPGFLQAHPGPIRVAHFDMDTYQSSLDALRLIYPRLVTGSVIIFDEFFGYPLWREGEARAWMEFCDETGVEFKYFVTSGAQVGIEILNPTQEH